MTSLLSTLLAASMAAHGAEVDMTSPDDACCDDQWSGDCVEGSVWGLDDTLAMGSYTDSANSVTAYAIFMEGASSTSPPTSIAADEVAYVSGTPRVAVIGWAVSSSSKLRVQVQYYDSSDDLIGQEQYTAHQGTAGYFSDVHEMSAPPASTASLRVRFGAGEDDLWLLNGSINPGHYTAYGNVACPEGMEGYADCWECDDGTIIGGFKEGGGGGGNGCVDWQGTCEEGAPDQPSTCEEPSLAPTTTSEPQVLAQ